MRIAVLSNVMACSYRTDGVSCTANTEYLTTTTAVSFGFLYCPCKGCVCRTDICHLKGSRRNVTWTAGDKIEPSLPLFFSFHCIASC